MENGESLAFLSLYFLVLCVDKSFDDEESVDGNRPSSAASAFKVPAPKTPGNPLNSARKPGSAGGPKVGGNANAFQVTVHASCIVVLSVSEQCVIHDCIGNAGNAGDGVATEKVSAF